MKKKLILLFPLMFLYFIVRLFWRSSKRLQHGGGHDTIYPLLPYSSGGMPRKNFLELYNWNLDKKSSIEISSDNYFDTLYGYGSKPHFNSVIMRIQNRKEIMKYFYLF